MDGSLVITAGALSSAVLQGIKMIWRKWVVKNPDYDFPVAFYAIMLPVLNALAPFGLVALGFPSDSPILSLDLPGVALYVVRVAIGALISMMAYDSAKKFNVYRKNV